MREGHHEEGIQGQAVAAKEASKRGGGQKGVRYLLQHLCPTYHAKAAADCQERRKAFEDMTTLECAAAQETTRVGLERKALSFAACAIERQNLVQCGPKQGL